MSGGSGQGPLVPGRFYVWKGGVSARWQENSSYMAVSGDTINSEEIPIQLSPAFLRANFEGDMKEEKEERELSIFQCNECPSCRKDPCFMVVQVGYSGTPDKCPYVGPVDAKWKRKEDA